MYLILSRFRIPTKFITIRTTRAICHPVRVLCIWRSITRVTTFSQSTAFAYFNTLVFLSLKYVPDRSRFVLFFTLCLFVSGFYIVSFTTRRIVFPSCVLRRFCVWIQRRILWIFGFLIIYREWRHRIILNLSHMGFFCLLHAVRTIDQGIVVTALILTCPYYNVITTETISGNDWCYRLV